MLNINRFCYLYLFLIILLTSVAGTNVLAHGQMDIDVPPVDVSSFPPAIDDIAALLNYSAYAGAAGQRLVERGVEVLTEAHGVLADPNSPFIQRIQLITVLGEIGDDSSASVIIEAAEHNVNNRYLYQNALLALSNFTQTEEIQQFVNRQLEPKERDPLIQRTALAYYAKQPTDDANHWVDVYAAPDASDDVRYAALYLGGVLGREDIKPEIINLLATKQSTSREYYLLLGYANVATMEEFNALVESKNLNADNVKKVREFLSFRLANAGEKKKLAPGLLNTNNAQLKQAVVQHLIEEKDADVLAANWKQGDSFVRAAVKRAGFNVSVDEHGAQLVEVPKTGSLTFWMLGLIFIVLAGVVFLLLRKRNNRR